MWHPELEKHVHTYHLENWDVLAFKYLLPTLRLPPANPRCQVKTTPLARWLVNRSEDQLTLKNSFDARSPLLHFPFGKVCTISELAPISPTCYLTPTSSSSPRWHWSLLILCNKSQIGAEICWNAFILFLREASHHRCLHQKGDLLQKLSKFRLFRSCKS